MDPLCGCPGGVKDTKDVYVVDLVEVFLSQVDSVLDNRNTS